MSQLEIPVISDGETWQRMLDEIRDVVRADSRGAGQRDHASSRRSRTPSSG